MDLENRRYPLLAKCPPIREMVDKSIVCGICQEYDEHTLLTGENGYFLNQETAEII